MRRMVTPARCVYPRTNLREGLHRPTNRVLSQGGQRPEAKIGCVQVQLPGKRPIREVEVPERVIRDLLHHFGISAKVPELRQPDHSPGRVLGFNRRERCRSGDRPSRNQPGQELIPGLLPLPVKLEPPTAKIDHGGCGHGDLENPRVHEIFPQRILCGPSVSCNDPNVFQFSDCLFN
jgi:hypothetical protein